MNQNSREVDFGIVDGEVTFGKSGGRTLEDFTASYQESPEWYASKIAKYYPDYGQKGAEVWVREDFGCGLINSPDQSPDSNHLGSFWTDLRDSIVGAAEEQAVSVTNALIEQGGAQIRDLITNQVYTAPPGYVAIGFDANGNPIFVPATSAPASAPITGSQFFSKYKTPIYVAMGGIGLFLTYLLIKPERR